MNQTQFLWVVLFLVHARLHVFALPLPLTGSKCHQDERSALLEFKHQLSNISQCWWLDSFPKLESWREESGDCCAWKGVECDGSSGHVIGLNLKRSCLYGSVSFISSIFRLVHLQRLNLAENNFNESIIPPAIGNLRGLMSLDLSNSNFIGQIPFQVLKLTNLSYLDLSHNSLKNPNMSSLIQSLTKLEHLNLSFVPIVAPFPDAITNLSSLRTLILQGCNLKGELPQAIFKLPWLEVLNLRYNEELSVNMPEFYWNSPLKSLLFSGIKSFGQLPASLGNMTSLSKLEISFCEISGSIPSWIGQLTHLVSFDLSGNQLTGEIPTFLGNLVGLTYIDLSYNQLSGEIPSSLGNLVQFNHLDLSHNKLSGEIPLALMKLNQLISLQMFPNEITGEIPSQTEAATHLDLRWNGEFYINMPEFYWSSPLKSVLIFNTKSFGQPPTSLGNFTSLIELGIFFCEISGSIPSWIGKLTHLNKLILRGNQLIGEIPSFLGNFVQLNYLALDNNTLSSEIPSFLENLVELTYLDLGNNQLSGQIPSFLGNCVRLVHLDLRNNQLSGEIPSFLGNLVRLTHLDFSHNQILGEIPPQIEGLTQVQVINLSYNKLHGLIPRAISKLKNLIYLGVVLNNLKGNVELDMFFGLESLNTLLLSFNNFSVSMPKINSSNSLSALGLASCDICDFPRFLGQLYHLEWLDLSHNSLHGQIPLWFFNVSTKYLRLLNLSNNYLAGFKSYPVELKWSDLWTLDLRYNYIQGQLPIPSASILFYLISNNRLSGEIPLAICQLPSITILDFAKNQLTGVLPSCLNNLSNTLSTLSLHGNKFYGRIPQLQRKICKLKMVDLNDNQLQGPLPRGLDECIQLEYLNFGNNRIVDTFPTWLGSLPNLKVLILHSNRFHGVIRESEANHPQFPLLHIIDLSMNNFSGSLPSKYFTYWNAMKFAEIGGVVYYADHYPWIVYDAVAYTDVQYDYSVTLINKGVEMEYVKILKFLTVIDFSNNNFSGEIPNSLRSLKELHLLNLSNNALTGSIPSSLGNLTKLEALDLSGNKLSGEIPLELTQLTSLESFNVSYNNLSGQIPRGYQFNTFEIDSYKGNLGLCGSPLSKKCENLEAPPPATIDEPCGVDSRTWIEEIDWKIVLMGFGSGLVVGVITGHNSTERIQHWFVGKFPGHMRRRQMRKARARHHT